MFDAQEEKKRKEKERKGKRKWKRKREQTLIEMCLRGQTCYLVMIEACGLLQSRGEKLLDCLSL